MKFFKKRLSLLVAKKSDKILAASLFILTDKEMYYFLSGADEDGYLYSANNLLLYQAVLFGKKLGKKRLILGGGRKINDSLFKFKSGFSPETKPFFIGSKIYNKSIYDNLVELCGAKSVDYFPQYRYNN